MKKIPDRAQNSCDSEIGDHRNIAIDYSNLKQYS